MAMLGIVEALDFGVTVEKIPLVGFFCFFYESKSPSARTFGLLSRVVRKQRTGPNVSDDDRPDKHFLGLSDEYYSELLVAR